MVPYYKLQYKGPQNPILIMKASTLSASLSRMKADHGLLLHVGLVSTSHNGCPASLDAEDRTPQPGCTMSNPIKSPGPKPLTRSEPPKHSVTDTQPAFDSKRAEGFLQGPKQKSPKHFETCDQTKNNATLTGYP